MTPSGALAWLCKDALPLWLEHGVDWKAGAFHEDIDPATLSPRAAFRRLRVTARQVTVFAQGARLGVPRAEDAVELGLAYLRHHVRRPDGGYARVFALDGSVIDETRDLYDHAFVLLAFAQSGRRNAARDALAYIDERFTHGRAGWCESYPASLPRRQNPHMHLLEAVLASAETFGDAVFLDHADTLVALFAERLFQTREGALPEFYDDALVPIREQGNFVVEPGHHHEWVWLLAEHRRIATAAGRVPRDTSATSRQLMTFAETHGVSDGGIVAGELWGDGRMKRKATRVWPHTERLRALLVQEVPDQAKIDLAISTLWSFFEGMPKGLWREHWDGGFVTGEASPASTLYHIAGAISALQRPIAELPPDNHPFAG